MRLGLDIERDVKGVTWHGDIFLDDKFRERKTGKICSDREIWENWELGERSLEIIKNYSSAVLSSF